MSTVPVRYFVLERTAGASSAIFERSPGGFTPLRAGPQPDRPPTEFTEMIIERLLGKKRPTAQEAARRLLILEYLLVYSKAAPLGKQLHDHAGLPPEAKADLHTIMGGLFSDRLRKDQLWDDVSPVERQFFECPVAKLTQQQVLNASWRSEAVRVLAWALGILPELPPYDAPAHGEITKLGPGEDVAGFIASARLRDEKEIENARDIAELWHWRSRTRQLMEEGQPFKPSEALMKAGLNTMEDIARMSAQEAAKRGDLPTCIADDYPARGKAYRDLDANEWSEVRSVTVERHFTLNWLCGYAPLNNWDDTPTDT